MDDRPGEGIADALPFFVAARSLGAHRRGCRQFAGVVAWRSTEYLPSPLSLSARTRK